MTTVWFTAKLRCLWARRIARMRLREDLRKVHMACKTDRSNVELAVPAPSTALCAHHIPLPEPPSELLAQLLRGQEPHPLKIGIVGAGISGLYLAMLFDELQIPGLTYEILESSNRTGGRVLTHYFDGEGEHHYDVGAMRFPDENVTDMPTSIERAFDLFCQAGVKLLPYDTEGRNCPHMFNSHGYIPDSSTSPEFDPYAFSVSKGGLVPDRHVLSGADCSRRTVEEGAASILERCFSPFKRRLVEEFWTGFEELLRFDHYTTRGYLRSEMGLDFYSIWYMENVLSSSGLYDQALSEAVLDSLDFDYTVTSGRKTEWYRVKGGTTQVVRGIESNLEHAPCLGKRVGAISYNPADTAYPMSVSVDGESYPREYSAVFLTASLPCVRRMDLGDNILSPGQKAAIQTVHYDSSTKIAIKFKTAWWTIRCGIRGGQASTDLPLRTCVYPSGPENSTVLLCSYTWGQDAQQLASLTRSPSEAELKRLLLHNLALLHQECRSPSGYRHGYSDILELIQDEYESMHAYEWDSDPNTTGAFAYFGPGQFVNFYPDLISPAADGHVYLVGEACSAHHAWVAGALESACRALLQFSYKLYLQNRIPPGQLERIQQRVGDLEGIERDVLEWQEGR
ncbi:hypothetical protein BJY01DRAFT_261437 [Aspergillus pseudoustus]|uniref:Amine oxidase domain-containing protein n=1 Tax=Aspergillus pseudoustus TaxID=1810923 RepID=A0ABR4KFV0_9EURO